MDKQELSLISRLFFSPEDAIIFNASRLLLLFETLNELDQNQLTDLDRLSYYDFFAANPFILIDKQNPLRIELETEGFKPNKLEYTAIAQRFRTKKLSIRQYISVLLSKGLLKIENKEGKILFKITPLGIEIASKFCSAYSIAYRKSASYIISTLKSYSDTKLAQDATVWLDSNPFQIDLIDLVDENE